jgi:hypothetical protein
MKKFAVALLFCGVSAFAATVTYTTTGDFTSTGTGTVTNGGETITYTDAAGSVSTPTFTNVGTFTVTGNSSGTFSDSFTLTILQTVPSTGSGTTSSAISGTITGTSSSISLSFVPSSFLIGPVTWEVFNTPLNNPSVAGGVTTIEAFVNVPEPGSLALIGASLFGLGLVARRRFMK